VFYSQKKNYTMKPFGGTKCYVIAIAHQLIPCTESFWLELTSSGACNSYCNS